MDWDATVRRLERVLARDPRSRLFLPLAEAHRELGHYGRATELFQNGVKLYPGHIRARIGLARTLFLMGRLDDSRRELHQVISLDPDNVLARTLLAQLYRKEGLFEQAAAEYRAVLRHHPEATEISEELASLGTRPLAVRPAPRGPQAAASTSTEDLVVSKSRSRKRLNQGSGVAASRRVEQAAAPVAAAPAPEPPRPAPQAALSFDEAFSLPLLVSAPADLSLQALLEEFFPGAFVLEEPEAAPAAPGIQTLSLVQLYIDQGFVSEARQMLGQILAADPKNQLARQKLETLRSAASEEGSAQEVLKRWLGAIVTVKRQRAMALLA